MTPKPKTTEKRAQPLRDDIASRIKQSRTQQKKTQQQIADLAGIGRSTLALYEKGHVVPGSVELESLCKSLNRSPNYLLSGSDEFFESDNLDHTLAKDESETVQVAKMALCLKALDREVRESISAMIMTLIKTNLPDKEYQGLIYAIEQIGQLTKEMTPGLENLLDEMLPQERIDEMEKDIEQTMKKAE